MKVETQEIATFDDGSKLVIPAHLKAFITESLNAAQLANVSGFHIHAIKFLRAEFGLSLRNAKDLTDYWRGMYVEPPVNLGELLRSKLDKDAA